MSAFFLYMPVEKQSPPLPEPVLNLLQGQLEIILLQLPAEASEQQLLQRLGLKLQAIPDEPADFMLFRQHFILYHLLYRIQHQWQIQQSGWLEIGLAKTIVSTWTTADSPRQPDEKAAYYLNWQHYYQMTPAALSEQLQQFWQDYISQLPQQTIQYTTEQALSQISLPQWPCTVTELKKAYRQQALACHPDRGGNPELFRQLNFAYRYLLQTLQR